MLRSVSGARNRTVLALVGLGCVIAALWLAPAPMPGLPWSGIGGLTPQGSTTLGAAADGAGGWLIPVATVLAVLAAVLAVAMLIAQIPRRAPALALHIGAGSRGSLAVLEPDVLARALEEEAESTPGVLNCSVHVSGAVEDLSIQASLTVDEDADLPWVLGSVRERLAASVRTAMGRAPSRVDVVLRLRSGPDESRLDPRAGDSGRRSASHHEASAGAPDR